MASNSFTTVTITDSTRRTRKGTQGRKQQFDKRYGQRLFKGDSSRIKAMGYSKNDLVRLATHKFLDELDNYVSPELLKP